MIALDRLVTYLENVDEIQILELLDLKTSDIIARFPDIIEARRHILEKEVELLPESVDELEFDAE
jgi:hypothetical protein